MDRDLATLLTRMTEALDRLAPSQAPTDALDDGEAFVWNPPGGQIKGGRSG